MVDSVGLVQSIRLSEDDMIVSLDFQGNKGDFRNKVVPNSSQYNKILLSNPAVIGSHSQNTSTCKPCTASALVYLL